jgi:hypothetical protein
MSTPRIDFTSNEHATFSMYFNEIGGVIPRVGDFVNGDIFKMSNKFKVESITFNPRQSNIRIHLQEQSF